MKSFRNFLTESLDDIEYDGDENAFALKVVAEIDDQISSIDSEIRIDLRPAATNGTKLGISQFMENSKRPRYAATARDIIAAHPDFELMKVPHDRKEKDYAFKHKDMKRYVYVNLRPTGKVSGSGDDPNELMTAALCLLPSLKAPGSVEEMDVLIDQVKKIAAKVKGYKPGQLASLDGDYANMCMAVSAALAVHKAGYGGADGAYLTGQAWHNDVKKFQLTKFGMRDFNSSDFILRKGSTHLGVSLKKKASSTMPDPTLINKSLTSLLNEPKFDKIKSALDDRAGEFYVHVIKHAQKLRVLSPQLEADIAKNPPSVSNWKQYIQRIPNDVVNHALKGRQTIFKDIGEIIIDNKELIADQLIQLIFKADLKDLKKVEFDFALVTGIGDYGPRKGVVIEQGDYKSIDNVTSKLEELFSKGTVNIRYTPNYVQAFQSGATAAVLSFDLLIGSMPICEIKLRYKGNFRAAPNFLATMTPEFKNFYHAAAKQ
jgi:hypothetical protein